MPDYLCRQPYLDLLKSIIANQSDNPSGYSFAIDGDWGCGKTWILTELENQLLEDSEHKYLIFHYNAWENDFYEEPLVAILSVMIEKLEEFCKAEEIINVINKKLAVSSLKILKNLAISIFGATVQNKIGIDVKDVVEGCKEIGDVKSDLKSVKKDVDSFLNLKNGIKEIRNQFTELSREHVIVLVVDELDRCLPGYAIKVLERLHHVCNEIPVIQIIAYSGNALAHSIAQIFGKNSSDEISNKAFAEHYLEKFVRLTIPLNCGNSKDDLICMYEGLTQNYQPCFNDSAEFLKQFYKLFLEQLPVRNKKHILDAIKMLHELVLASGDFKEFTSSYELLCCEILISVDRIFFHAQSPLKIEFSESENNLHLCFNVDRRSRYNDIIDVEYFIQVFESIKINAQIQQEPLWKKDYYEVSVRDSLSVIFLTLVDGKNIQIENNYSYQLGRPATDIVNQNKKFIKRFYSYLYRFFDNTTDNKNN